MMQPLLTSPDKHTQLRIVRASYRDFIRNGWNSNSNPENFKKKLDEIGENIGTILKSFFDNCENPKGWEGADLALILDKNTAKIPWELAILDKDSPAYLCEIMNLGRVIDVPSEVPIVIKNKRRKHKALVIGINYNGDLKGAIHDAEKVRKELILFKRKNKSLEVLPALLGCKANKSAISKYIEEGITFLHFSGHGGIEGCNGEIQLKGNETMTAEDLLKIMTWEKRAPTFSFFNACRTATCIPSDPKITRSEVFNMARTMADQGGRTCIGTFWDVDDNDSVIFSLEFYKNFFRRRLKIGESIRLARLEIRKCSEEAKSKQGKQAIFTWPAYVLYGSSNSQSVQHSILVMPVNCPFSQLFAVIIKC